MDSRQKVACLLTPNLPTQVEQQRLGANLPLIIPHPVEDSTVFAASPEVLAAGVKPGTSVYQARQSAPFARVVEPDETAYHARHGAIEASLRAFSPILETVALGEFLLDARGLERSLGDDPAITHALHAAAGSASGLAVCIGLAANKFVAQQAARQAAPQGICIVPAGSEARFMATLPVSVLPNLPGEMRRRLEVLGLYTLGDLAALKKAAVLRQFGAEASSAYELARGNDPRPLNPDAPPLKIVRSMQFGEPVADRRILLHVVQRLSGKLAEMLDRKGYHAEALQLTLLSISGKVSDGREAKPPTSDPARLGRLTAQMLGRLQPDAPVLSVVLCAYPLRPWHLGMRQLVLAEAGVPERQTRLEEAVQLLWRRFGQTAVRIASFLGPPVPLPVQVTLNDNGLPLVLEFGGQRRAVIAIDAKWRVAKYWWDLRPIRRDYFRVQLSDGSLRNIYEDLMNHGWYLDRAWPIL